MNSLLFIKKRSFINKLKRRLKKPITYIMAIPVMLILISYIFSLGSVVKNMNINTPSGFCVILILFSVPVLCGNIMTYSKRKGLIFTNADVNFCFSAPINPKHILIYAGYNNFKGNVLMGIFGSILGVAFCGVSVYKALLLLLFVSVFETIFEMSIIIILYGGDCITPGISKAISWFFRILLGAMAVLMLMEIVKTGNVASMINVLLGDDILLIPIIGWNIALIRLVMLGHTGMTLYMAIAYILVMLVTVVLAVRIKCSGEYYEAAMTFADDYEEALKKSKEGGIAIVGKKDKYKKADVSYKGEYAKAIYYRQLLEAKKQRFGRYGLMILIYPLISLVISYAIYGEKGSLSGMVAYMLLGISAYITFLSSEMKSKLEKEINSPYTFLIPDNVFKKLYYSTRFDIERALTEGALLAVPAGIILRINIVEVICVMMLHCIVRCIKMYIGVAVEAWLGESVINFIKSIVKMLIFATIIVLGILIIIVAEAFKLTILGLVLAVVFGIINLGILMLISSKVFVRMEILK